MNRRQETYPAQARYEAALRVVGWDRDPGPDGRDRVSLARRRVSLWLATSKIDGVEIPAYRIAEAAGLVHETVARVKRSTRRFPGDGRHRATTAIVRRYRDALRGGSVEPADIGLLIQAAKEIWDGDQPKLGRPRGQRARAAGRA